MAAINSNIRWIIKGKEYRYIKDMAKEYNLPVNRFMNYMRNRITPDGYFIREITVIVEEGEEDGGKEIPVH